MKKKVLIIYEKMGMGHLRMAQILGDSLKNEDVEVEICAGSELIQDNSINTVVKLWNFCIRKNYIKTVDLLLNFIFRIFLMPFVEVNSTVTFGNKLAEIKPDIIVSTADGFNRAIGTYAKDNNIPFYIFITEVSLFIDLVNPYATHICYFNETGEAIQNYDFNYTYYSYKLNKDTTFLEKVEYIMKYYKDFVVFGFKNSIFRNPNRQLEQNNEAKFRVVGPLAERKHYSKKDIEKIKEQYGLNNGKDTVILASGSIGGRFLLEMVSAIYKKCERPINLIVVCGKDEKTYEKLKSYSGVSLSVNLMPFKYIDKFDEVLAAADCIIGRPSAGIFIESILNRTPEITFRKATSNDKGTLTMIEKYNMGKVIESKEDLAPALEDILNNKELYVNNIEKLINKYTLSYEDKTELIKNIILTDDNLNYELNEIKAPIGFNAHMSN